MKTRAMMVVLVLAVGAGRSEAQRKRAAPPATGVTAAPTATAASPPVYLPHLGVVVTAEGGWQPAFLNLPTDPAWRDSFTRTDGDVTTRVWLVPLPEPCARGIVARPAWLGGGTVAARPAFVPSSFHDTIVTLDESSGGKEAAMRVACLELSGRSVQARILFLGPRKVAAGDPAFARVTSLLGTVATALRGGPAGTTSIKLPESGNTIALPALGGWSARKVKKRGKEMIDQLTRAAPASPSLQVTVDWEPRSCAADKRARSTAVVPLRMPKWEGGYQSQVGSQWQVEFCTDEMTVSAWVVFISPDRPGLDFPLTAYTVLSALDRGMGRLTDEEVEARKKKAADDAMFDEY